MKKHGRCKIQLLALVLCIFHWVIAGKMNAMGQESDSGRVAFAAPHGRELKKDHPANSFCSRAFRLGTCSYPYETHFHHDGRDAQHGNSSGIASGANSKLANLPPIALVLQTNSLSLATKRTAWLHLGYELRSNWQAPITRVRGDLHRYGTLRFDFGLADNVSLQIRGAIRQVLRSGGQSVARDAGDFSLATIARVWPEGTRRPALGFRIETKLPNTNQDRGIGNNTTDITMSILATKQFGPASLFSELGLVIMAAPRQINDQNDALVYGLGLMWNVSKNILLAGEIQGFASPRSQIPLGTEDRSAARLALVRKWTNFSLEMLAVRGLTAREGNWGVVAGLSSQLSL